MNVRYIGWFAVLATVGWPLGTHTPSAAAESWEPGLEKAFVAVYEVVASPESLNGKLVDGVLSGDGQRVLLRSWDADARKLRVYWYHNDNRQLREIPMPADYDALPADHRRAGGEPTLSRDGSRAYFSSAFIGQGRGLIYKVEDDRITTILDAHDHQEINGVYNLRTTADGQWVYFAEDRVDLWRVSLNGGKPERVIAFTDVPRDGGRSAHFGEYDISEDGSTIVFIMRGYRDEDGAWREKNEVFVACSGQFRQVTNDPKNVSKHHPTISSDGSTIMYAAGADQRNWFSANASGGEPRPLEPLGDNSTRPHLTANGSTAFYYDTRAEGGRLVWTDGSQVLNLFPSGNMGNITLAAVHPNPWISEAGDRVLFRFSDRLYLGHLKPTYDIPTAPVLRSVHLVADPASGAEPDSRFRFSVQVEGNVDRVSTDSMIGGRFQGDPGQLALNVHFAPNDKGTPPDAQAGDQVFTTWAYPGKKPEVLTQQMFRIGATTKEHNIVTVVDYWLQSSRTPPADAAPPMAERPQLDPDKVIFDPNVGCELVNDEVLVTVYRGTTREQLEEALKGLGFEAKILDTVPGLNLYKIGVPAARRVEARERLAVHPIVGAAGYNGLWTTAHDVDFNDPVFDSNNPDDWNLRMIHAPAAWRITTGGALIAVIDSGAQLDHEELQGKTLRPFSYATNSQQMQDGEVPVRNEDGTIGLQWITSHGTHVAVTAAGRANNGAGTAGVAPQSPVIPIQHLYYVPQLMRITNTDFELNVAIDRALAAEAQVINLSLGRSFRKEVLELWENPATRAQVEPEMLRNVELWLQPLRGALDEAHARRVIICKAAGNDGIPARFDYIANSGRAIVVAAVDPTARRCDFSNFGEFTTVSAPGEYIYSATTSVTTYGYSHQKGTSMAAPHVAGVIALMKSLRPNLTFEEARDILVSTGRPLNTSKPIGPLVNAHAALVEQERRLTERIPPPAPLPPLIPQPPPTTPPPANILDDPELWKHPQVQRLIDEWLARAIPNLDPATGPWFYDRYGRALNNKTIFATQPPDYAADRYRVIWESAGEFNSSNLGILYDYVVKRLNRE